MNEQEVQFYMNGQGVPSNKKTKKRRGTWVLILVLLLVVLFLATSAVVGYELYRKATRDTYSVDLEMANPTGSLELFRVQYSNDASQVTVHGTNGQEVVAPGTEIDYSLRLRNHDECVIDFIMNPTVEFHTKDEVPVEFKVMDDYGNYILGSETQWVTAEQFGQLEHQGRVQPSEVYTYHISWRWAFETSPEQDVADTQLATYEGEDAPGLTVTVKTQSSANTTPERSDAHTMHLLGEGFGCCICCWLVWLLLLVCVLLVIWVWRLRRKLSKLEEDLEDERNNGAE